MWLHFAKHCFWYMAVFAATGHCHRLNFANHAHLRIATSAAAANGPGQYQFGEEARALWNQYVTDVTRRYKTKGPGIQAGCVPTLYENQATYRGTVLLLHGFSACPQQFEELIPMLTSKGFVVLIALNPGHGANFVRNGIKVKDFVDFMPSDEQEYKEFGDRMNSIMAKAGGDRVVFGLSLGGAIASYLISKQEYTRQLIAVPMFRIAGLVDGGVRIINKIPGVRHKRISWGEGCEVERKGGRAGICQFRISHVAAARKLGLGLLKAPKMPLPTTPGRIQFLFTENDPAVDVNAALQFAKKLGLEDSSKGICGWDEAIGHSFLSAYDNPKENKYWLLETLNKVADFLVNGTAFPQDGTFSNGKASPAWPRCQLTCTPEICPWKTTVTSVFECPDECADCCTDKKGRWYNKKTSITEFKCILKNRDVLPRGRSCGSIKRRDSKKTEWKVDCEYSAEERSSLILADADCDEPRHS